MFKVEGLRGLFRVWGLQGLGPIKACSLSRLLAPSGFRLSRLGKVVLWIAGLCVGFSFFFFFLWDLFSAHQILGGFRVWGVGFGV